jgi:hypothetical protein
LPLPEGFLIVTLVKKELKMRIRVINTRALKLQTKVDKIKEQEMEKAWVRV